MTRVRAGGMPHIEAEAPGACQDCGKQAETRPYGPGGIEACFDCAMKDEEEAKRRFMAFLEGTNPHENEGGGDDRA